MRINILALSPDATPVPFKGALDLSYIVRWAEHPFPEPVAVSGKAYNRHGQTLVELTAEYTLHTACARCLQPVTRLKSTYLEYVAVEKLEEDSSENWAEAPGGMLDLTTLVGADLLMELDRAELCDEECKGICPVCGVDRNQTDCDCDTHNNTDPRFAALLELLDDE